MAQIQGGETFAIGQQFTATRANNHVNGAILLPGAVTDQPNIAANTVEATDSVILHDSSASALREATMGDLLNSGLDITVNEINIKPITGGLITAPGDLTGGGTNGKIILSASDVGGGQYPLILIGDDLGSSLLPSNPEIQLNGPTEIKSPNSSGDTLLVSGTSKFSGRADFDTNTAIKLPVGTTAQRPSSPVQGDIRFNSTTTQTEVYNGTAWEEVGGGPFDATGGNTIIAPDTTVISGVSFTSANGYHVTVTHSGHSVTPGQTIKFTTTVAGYSGEFTVYEADATTFKFFMVTVATPNSGTGSYQKAGNFKCHIFTSSGTFVAGNKEGYVQVLVVGGGGGGSRDAGGAGGGFVEVQRYKVNANQTIAVTVGAGGPGANNNFPTSGGQDSIFGTITAYGGGPGRGNYRGGIYYGSSVFPVMYDPVGAETGGAGAGSRGYPNNWPGRGVESNLSGVTKNYSWGGGYPGLYNTLIYPDDIRTTGTANTGRGGERSTGLSPGSSGIVIVRYPYWI